MGTRIAHAGRDHSLEDRSMRTPDRRTRTGALLFSAVILSGLPARAQEDDPVQRIGALVEKMRPSEEDLEVYALDWADSLEEALERAKTEDRPICLVANRAPFADLKNGHC